MVISRFMCREENNSRPSAKNRPKSWNGRLPTQLTGHQADQSKRDRASCILHCFFCVCKIMSMHNYVTVTVGGARASHIILSSLPVNLPSKQFHSQCQDYEGSPL